MGIKRSKPCGWRWRMDGSSTIGGSVAAGHAARSTAAAAGTTRQECQQFGKELGMSMEEGETGVAAGEVGAGQIPT